MRKIIILVLLSTLFLLACEDKKVSNADVKVNEANIEKSISDLEQLVKATEDIHPHMFAYTNEDSFRNEVEQIKDKFEDGSQLEFYRLVAPLFASLNDVKTTLDPLGNYFTSSIENGGSFFPYQIEIISGRFYIKSSYIDDKQLAGDTEIFNINEFTSNEVYDNLMRYVSGISIAEREYILTREFHRLFYMIYGDIKEFTFQTDSNTFTVSGANIENIVLQDLPVNKTYTYKNISEGVGVITINKFDGFSGFKRFTDATFIKMNDEKINTLIIDISDNIGGNPEFSKYVLSFISEKPFRLYGDIKAKISDEVKAQDNFMRANYSDKVGEVISAEFNDESRKYEPEVFIGDIYLIIGAKTHSIASELAAAVKHYKIGTVIGTDTASNSSSFKTTYSLTSDNLNVALKIPYKYYIDASGIDNKSTVSPDVVIEENAIEYILGLVSN